MKYEVNIKHFKGLWLLAALKEIILFTMIIMMFMCSYTHSNLQF